MCGLRTVSNKHLLLPFLQHWGYDLTLMVMVCEIDLWTTYKQKCWSWSSKSIHLASTLFLRSLLLKFCCDTLHCPTRNMSSTWRDCARVYLRARSVSRELRCFRQKLLNVTHWEMGTYCALVFLDNLGSNLFDLNIRIFIQSLTFIFLTFCFKPSTLNCTCRVFYSRTFLTFVCFWITWMTLPWP